VQKPLDNQVPSVYSRQMTNTFIALCKNTLFFLMICNHIIKRCTYSLIKFRICLYYKSM